MDHGGLLMVINILVSEATEPVHENMPTSKKHYDDVLAKMKMAGQCQ